MKPVVSEQQMKGQALKEEQYDQIRISFDEKKNVPHGSSRLSRVYLTDRPWS
jgi:hypothetical protein